MSGMYRMVKHKKRAAYLPRCLLLRKVDGKLIEQI